MPTIVDQNERNGTTPLPIVKVLTLGLMLTANNTAIWMIFSFLPFVVKHFYPDLNDSQLGYRAGILGSAFSLGGLLGNIVWGISSDTFGRRPALLLGAVGGVLSSILFGFSPTFWFSVVSRLLWGLLTSNVGVAKTYLGEIW